jgi:hypothetical protein
MCSATYFSLKMNAELSRRTHLKKVLHGTHAEREVLLTEAGHHVGQDPELIIFYHT